MIHLIKLAIWFVLLAGCSLCIEAQPEINHNYIGDPYIKSIKFHPLNAPLDLPVLDLKNYRPIVLHFDDLSEEISDYTYSVYLCNYDWSLSDLTEFDYLEGFQNNDIESADFSFNTTVPFTHYTLSIPNRDLSLKLSGNYLLVVYHEDDQETPVVIRRFMAYEQTSPMYIEKRPPVSAKKLHTHHEFDFSINIEDLGVRNPRTELRATVLQNDNWEMSITDLSPNFIKGELALFDFQDKVIFPAGREFRTLDFRSFRMKTGSVEDIFEVNGGYELTLRKDEKRPYKPYTFFNDFNGSYIIENFHRTNSNLESDYGQALFSLYSPSEIYDHDVYLFGEMTDWTINPDYRMIYNDLTRTYVGKFLLKQGYYNYWYVTVPKNSKKMSFDETEGSRYETQNDYTFLVYYRPFGARHDALIGYRNAATY